MVDSVLPLSGAFFKNSKRRAGHAWRFAWPGLFASLLATLVAGVVEAAHHVDGAYTIASATGFAAYLGTFAAACLFWAGRGLWHGWQASALIERHTDESGGAPAIAAWLFYVGVALATVAFTALNAVHHAQRKFTFPQVASLATAMAMTVLAAILIVLSRPVVRLLTHGFRRLDAIATRRLSRSPFHPRVLLAVSVLAFVAYLVGVWYVSVAPRIGHLDLGVERYASAYGIAALVAYPGWFALARTPRLRIALSALVLAAWLGVLGTALHARHIRPFTMLEVWGEVPVAGLAVELAYRVDRVRAEFKLAELRPTERPGAAHHDIVLITVDTVRADRTPPYGGEASMPALARMADAGLVFERAFSPGNTTRRSLPAMATGVSPHRVRGRLVGWALKMDPRHVTVAERLRAAGYETAGFFCCAGQFNPDIRIGLERGIEHVVIDLEGATLVPTALEWLRMREKRAPTKPLFVWIHLFEPHRWDQLYPADRYGTASKPRYDRLLADTDTILAPLTDYLIAPARKRTMYTILTSDHGEGLGDHGVRAHSETLYNHQIHVPFLITGPDVPRRRIDMPVSLVDLAPTLLDLAGYVPPGMPQMDGDSLAPYVRGQAAPRLEEGQVYTVQIKDRSVSSSISALVHGRDKLIVGPGAERQLFDIVADPGETKNRFESDPDTAARLMHELEERQRIDDIPPF